MYTVYSDSEGDESSIVLSDQEDTGMDLQGTTHNALKAKSCGGTGI